MNQLSDLRFCMRCGHHASYLIPAGDSRPRLVCLSCDYIHYDNPKVVSGVIAVHDGKILLCRRAIEPRYGYWTLPAGFLEIGETMAEGALRETVEEADAIATDAKLYALINIPHLGQIHVFYVTTLKDGRFGCGTESLECRLFAPSEIPWDELSFKSVICALQLYLADTNQNPHNRALPVHERTIYDTLTQQ